MDFQKISEIKKKLNEINFGRDGIIILNDDNDDVDIANEHYCANYRRKGKIKDVCKHCDNNNCNKPNCDGYSNYKLLNMSHGTHTLDYICSHYNIENLDDCKDKLKDWNDIPVLFLFENPSKDYGGLYCEFGGKRPANEWYWASGYSDKDKAPQYPDKLGYKEYGGMVYSLISMFKLGNAYITNLVKCGMNDKDNKYLDTNYYSESCIENCVEKHLLKEIKALIINEVTNAKKRLVVFAFGKRTYDLIKNAGLNELFKQLDVEPTVCLMPHPASRLSDDYRKYVLFAKAYKALCSYNVDCKSAHDAFLNNDKITASNQAFT